MPRHKDTFIVSLEQTARIETRSAALEQKGRRMTCVLTPGKHLFRKNQRVGTKLWGLRCQGKNGLPMAEWMELKKHPPEGVTIDGL